MTWPRPSRRSPQELLERRDRRLMACYPASYQAANADEMLGVALSGAAPGQRRPSLGEATSLAAAGLRMRGSALLGAARGPAWGDAGAAFAVIGPVLLAAINAERVTGSLFASAIGEPGQVRPAGIVLAAGWLLAAAAAMLGRRRAAAAGASLAATGEAVRLAARYASDPSSLVTSWWQLILALPAGSAAALTAWGFGGFLAASPRFTPPVMLTAPQWAALAIVPLLSFAAGAAWLGRHERTLRPGAEGHQAPA